VDSADLVAAVRRLSPPQHVAAMAAVAQARQTGDLATLVETLATLAEETRAAEA
jgi:hypothetical protein